MLNKIYEICAEVLEYGYKGDLEALELMDDDSEIYKKIEQKILDFCNTYGYKID